MNRDQFNKTEFTKGMQVIVSEGESKTIHNLIGVDFELMLIGINLNNDLELSWIDAWRCEIVK